MGFRRHRWTQYRTCCFLLSNHHMKANSDENKRCHYQKYSFRNLYSHTPGRSVIHVSTPPISTVIVGMDGSVVSTPSSIASSRGPWRGASFLKYFDDILSRQWWWRPTWFHNFWSPTPTWCGGTTSMNLDTLRRGCSCSSAKYYE